MNVLEKSSQATVWKPLHFGCIVAPIGHMTIIGHIRSSHRPRDVWQWKRFSKMVTIVYGNRKRHTGSGELLVNCEANTWTGLVVQTIQYVKIQHNIKQHNTVQSKTVQYNTIQYRTTYGSTTHTHTQCTNRMW